jgi:hypothetical protein
VANKAVSKVAVVNKAGSKASKIVSKIVKLSSVYNRKSPGVLAGGFLLHGLALAR